MKPTYLFVLLYFVSFTLQAQKNYSIASIPSEFIQNANSVLVYENESFEVMDGKIKIETERVVTVLNELGNRSVAAVSGYDNSSSIEKIEAYLYDSFGNEIEHYRKGDFKDVSAADGVSIYNDDRVLYLDFTPTFYPYTIAFKSKKVENSTAFIYPWTPIDRYAMSVLEANRTISYDPNNTVKYKCVNCDNKFVTISETQDAINLNAANIKALAYEEHSPPFDAIRPKVYFGLDRFSLKGVPGFGKDWEEFGKWMYSSLLKETNDLPESTKIKIKSLVASETTNEGKARKVYQFVQDKVRYISVQIGIGGWKPMLASEVEKLSYGDCKALTNYTKALLDEVGVPSYYTVLNAGNVEEDIMSDFTSMQGNHAFLAVGNPEENLTWLECTSQDTPFGYLGNFSDDRDVLLITPEGGKIVHTKTYTQEENLQKNKGNITINNDGSASATVTTISEGLQYDGKYNLEKLTKDELINTYKNRWSNLMSISLDEMKLSNNREEIVFTEVVKLSLPSITSKVGDDMLLELNSFNQSGYIPPRISDRKQKLELQMAFTDVDEVLITLPKNFKFDSLPENKKLQTKFGTYSMNVEVVDDTTIKYKRELLMNKGVFPPEDYNDFRTFRRAIVKMDQTKILLKPIE